jgi:adenylate kinase family enzyme
MTPPNEPMNADIHAAETPFRPTLLNFDSPEACEEILSARRILVLGSSGSGKTHLSHRLAGILGIDPIHLDAYFWQPGARPRGDREWRGVVPKLVQRESWIMDGTYERSLDLRIPYADAIILLDCPSNRCLKRVLEREKEFDGKTRRDRVDGCSERIDWNHVRYVMQYSEVTHPRIIASIERYGSETPVVAIDAPEAVEVFVSKLESTVAARAGSRRAPARRVGEEIRVG